MMKLIESNFSLGPIYIYSSCNLPEQFRLKLSFLRVNATAGTALTYKNSKKNITFTWGHKSTFPMAAISVSPVTLQQMRGAF